MRATEAGERPGGAAGRAGAAPPAPTVGGTEPTAALAVAAAKKPANRSAWFPGFAAMAAAVAEMAASSAATATLEALAAMRGDVGPDCATTGAYPAVLGWYMRNSRQWNTNAPRSAGSSINAIVSTAAAICFSCTARPTTAMRRIISRCCAVRAATPWRRTVICAARSSGVARSNACSTYTRAKLRTMGGRSRLTYSAVRSVKGSFIQGCAFKRLLTCDKMPITFCLVLAWRDAIWSMTRGMSTCSTRSSLLSSVKPSDVSALSSAASSSASVAILNPKP
mmetsp:Transcript_14752/g.36101  ORF Transcript_14752/g.36101 Transcript_14752/m.36101 type:complete len:280 (-) Transcript_14752:232-1071(-)